MKLATRLVHAGQEPDPLSGAINVPINTSTTYKQDGIGKPRQGYEYARSGNPSRSSLEQTLAAIECGAYGLCFASGSAATTAVVSLLRPGDEILTTADVYGGSYRLFARVFGPYGIGLRLLRTHGVTEWAAALSPRTKLLWVETPTNPLLNIVDIKGLADMLRARSADDQDRRPFLVVDNTFASPYFQTPLELGADIVVHSTTKYLGGHSDVVGGCVVTSDRPRYQAMKYYQNAAGAVPSPFDCYLVQRGIKTLGLRMERHQSNAREVATFLRGHPKVERVFYAGFSDHPQAAIVRTQMRGQPGMVAFALRGGRAEVDRFLERLTVFVLAESLGAVESLACYPYLMTHGAIPAAEKQAVGISEGLVRLSVGIEDAEDLISDLSQALAGV